MNITYNIYPDLPAEPLLTSVVRLLQSVFNNRTLEETAAELRYQQARTPIQTCVAMDGEQVVGCKLGYERQPQQFYSWLGCVAPGYRGHGIATELMHRQHHWCREQGYQTVRTQTYNQWRSMLLLNLQTGFDIIGTVQGKYGLMIVLEKGL